MFYKVIMLLTQISMKKKKNTTSSVTSWLIPLREVLWETNTVAPALFTCFCRERNPACPGVLVFWSVLPSPACDRGCGCVVMSGLSVGSSSHLPSWDQPPLEEASVSFLRSRAQEAPPSRQALVPQASTSRPLGYLSEGHLYPQSV